MERFIDRAKLGVLFADVAGGEVANELDVRAVDDRGKELLALAVALPDRDPDERAGLVLLRFVAQADRGGFPPVAEDVLVEVGVKIEREHAVGGSLSSGANGITQAGK